MSIYKPRIRSFLVVPDFVGFLIVHRLLAVSPGDAQASTWEFKTTAIGKWGEYEWVTLLWTGEALYDTLWMQGGRGIA